jgi:hypothetical protein
MPLNQRLKVRQRHVRNLQQPVSLALVDLTDRDRDDQPALGCGGDQLVAAGVAEGVVVIVR